MPNSSNFDIQCETIQDSLDTAFETCNPVMDAMPALEAILATQKAAGISQLVSDGNGKVKTVRVTFDQRALESDAQEVTGDRTCTTNNKTLNSSAVYDIDPHTHLTYGELINVSELATVCQDFASYYSKKIAKIIDVLERKAATQVATSLVAGYGNWGTAVPVNGSNELVISTLVSTATKVIDYSGMSTIDLSLMQTGFCQSPIIVGGAALYQYGKHINAGCCSTTGVDILNLANQFGKAILYDKRVEAALGSTDKAIAFQPGAVAIITYNEFNETTLVGSNYAKLKVFSPRTGLPIDIVIKDDCGSISIIGYLTVKLVTLPSNMFAVGDEYAGVNFVNKILVTNPA